MDFGDSVLKPFKKLKRRLAGGSRKLGRGEAGIKAGERGDPAASVPQSALHVDVEDMRDREGNGTDVEGSRGNMDQGVEVVVESAPSQEANDIDGTRIGRVDPPGPPAAPADSNCGNHSCT